MAKATQKVKTFPVVGIGGSAGSFTSFEKFFTHTPADSGIAFVIVVHLDPKHRSQLDEVIQRYTAMPVIEATDGITLQPDKVYIIPPNKDMGIHNKKLLLLSPGKPNGVRQPIDYFLQSLAEDQWNRSVAIIFSGMGSDGETGVRMIKEKLGMAMVQDPDTADYDSMPRAAIGTNLVDFVLAPEEMPVKLIQYLNHPAIAEEASEQIKAALQNNNAMQKTLMLLRAQTGHDFSLYKKSTVTRRIDRRIAFLQLPDYNAYVTYLGENPQETELLFNELLIGVTKFFRDAPAFESLKIKVEKLIRKKKKNDTFRVWITGCSTGEEAYSIAMLLIECMDVISAKEPPKIQIYATDLDTAALEIARNGIYHSNIVADVSPERLTRFFTKNEDLYSVRKELREMIVFAQQNVVKDAPFIKLDLLSCRNMLIYFTSELQKKIIPLFHYALNPGGLMFMGPAETIGGFTDMFSPADPKWKIFERKEGTIQISKMIDFPFQITKQTVIHKPEESLTAARDRLLPEIFNKVLIEQFTPASVMVNEKGDILYSNGKTGPYLQLPGGEAVMNIHRMAREELKYAVDSSIQQALQQDSQVVIEDIKLKGEKRSRLVRLKASLIKEAGMQTLVLIVFEDHGSYKRGKQAGLSQSVMSENPAAEELERELVYTKQRLNSTIEQMESSLEELKSSNEELQSTNEELQSTNEESLTTKEEMQSLNEELMTLNTQYQSKAEDLTRLNNDMKNLLDATGIGTIFLDNDLTLVRYTPQVRKLFNLIPTDLGRPISHVVSNFEQAFNDADIREVIDKLTIKEIDSRTKTDEWFRIRIMPYRTLDNFISGAVLTFTPITDYKQMQSRLGALQDYSASLLEQIPGEVALLDHEFKIVHFNQRFLKRFDLTAKEITHVSLPSLLKERWQTEVPEQLLNRCLSAQSEVTSSVETGGIPVQYFELTAKPYANDTNHGTIILVTIHEQQ